MKPIPYSMIAILILTVILSGCGGNGGNSGGRTYTPGQSSTYKVGDVMFNMHYVPAISNFPTGTDNSGTGSVGAAYWMAETEVTYRLWFEVETQMNVTYNFSSNENPGDGNGDSFDNPVTTIDWYDAIVWCNALTEYYNLKNGTNLGCVYKSGGLPIRNSTVAKTLVTIESDTTAKGFRLPTSMEWELAARYRGNDSTNAISRNGIYYTNGNSASGATADYNNEVATQKVAWSSENSDNSTHPVGTAGSLTPETPLTGNANTLGLYDMSGNVWEWCFDFVPSYEDRVIRGGAWFDSALYLQVGDLTYGHIGPLVADHTRGFRLVRTQ